MSRFANLATKVPNETPKPLETAIEQVTARGAGLRQNAAIYPESRKMRKAITGYFSPELSLALNILAKKRGMSLQAVMGEAFDDYLRKHGEHPIGDR